MKIVVNPKYKYLEKEIHTLPSVFRKEGDILYDDRNQIKLFNYAGIKITVKSFHVPFFINQIVYTFFRESKAMRSYSHALILQEKGINTPEPVACIENRRGGLLHDSYYVCLLYESTGMMRELRTGPLVGREALLKAFARFTAQVHEQGVLHLDYSPGNILYRRNDDGYEFTLLDINRMKFRPVDMQTGCSNLRRLWGSEEMIVFIAEEYAHARGFDPAECVRLTLEYHQQFWKKFTKKHGRTPYDE